MISKKELIIRLCQVESDCDYLFQQLDLIEDRLKKLEKGKREVSVKSKTVASRKGKK